MKNYFLLTGLLLVPGHLAIAQDNACMGSTRVDPCVVGTWILESGGPVAWMQGMCGMIRDATQGKLEGQGGIGSTSVTYHADGSYEASSNSFRMMILNHSHSSRRHDPGHVNLQGTVQPATGRWSVSGETLYNCQDSGGLDGTIYTSDIDHRPSTNVPGMGGISMEYTCSETTLNTSMSMGYDTSEFRDVLCSLFITGEPHGIETQDPGVDFPMTMKFVRGE